MRDTGPERERSTDASVESTDTIDCLDGMGLLPIETQFVTEKRVEQVTREIDGTGPLSGATGPVSGYEIHMGRSTPTEDVAQPLGPESAATHRVLGTYIHGLFENESAREAFVDAVFEAAHTSRPDAPDTNARQSPYDRAAALVDLSPFGF